MERHEIMALMCELKLAGMRAAYDETMRDGVRRRRSAPAILGDLLRAELAESEAPNATGPREGPSARSIRYQMSAARFPVMKNLGEFDFDASPANEALVRSLHTGEFLDQTRNAVFVGGTGTGKSHFAIAIGASAVNSREGRKIVTKLSWRLPFPPAVSAHSPMKDWSDAV